MEKIKKLEVRKSVENVLAKGCYTLGVGGLGGTVALNAVGYSSSELAIVSCGVLGLSCLFACLADFTGETIKEQIKKEEEIPILGRRKFHELEGVTREIPTVETTPLLTEEESHDVKLDASAIESKPLVKHK